jgi:hypothetical protein
LSFDDIVTTIYSLSLPPFSIPRSELMNMTVAEVDTYWSVYLATYHPEKQTDKYEKHKALQDQLPPDYVSNPVYGKVRLNGR